MLAQTEEAKAEEVRRALLQSSSSLTPGVKAARPALRLDLLHHAARECDAPEASEAVR
jgi:hypothetical protein